MATEFNYDCPHCTTRKAGFLVRYQWSDRGNANRLHFLAVCNVCNLGITVSALDLISSSANLLQMSYNFPSDRFHIERVWPKVNSVAPLGVPENVSGFFLQGVENINAARWDAAGAMFRKTLDVSTKILNEGSKSLTLFKRINHLVQIGTLTPSMGDWSHEIRLDGNEAVHDDMPETEEDARSSHHFTEAFLTYAFSLPHLVAENRSKRLLIETS